MRTGSLVAGNGLGWLARAFAAAESALHGFFARRRPASGLVRRGRTKGAARGEGRVETGFGGELSDPALVRPEAIPRFSPCRGADFLR